MTSQDKTEHSTAQQTEVGGPYARYVLVILVIVYVFNFIDRQILSILAEEIKADLNITDSQLGFLYGTAFAVFYAVFGIPLGRLADVWVRTRLIAIGLAFWSFMTALSGFAKGFGQLAVCRFGVGIGEASATPAANSLIADYFPPRVRATVLAIYASGIYIGAGIGIFIGGAIVDQWNLAFPDPATAPLGLKGWQAAFLAVGLPGLLLALVVGTLREPVRGQSEGHVTPPHPAPFLATFKELISILPPLTLIGLYMAGGRAGHLALNVSVAAGLGLFAIALTHWLGDPIQWWALGIGIYAAFSWIQSLQHHDAATYRVMFHSKTFYLTLIGFPCISFVTYGVGFWTVPFLLREHGVSETEVGTFIGLGAAIGGLIGVTLGGVVADRLQTVTSGSRYLTGILAAVLAIPTAVFFLLTDNKWVAYIMSFLFSAVAPMWIGPSYSAVIDLVLPRMRAAAMALFLFAATFIGLAMGPYTMGKLSDFYATTGFSSADALKYSMLTSCSILVVAILTLFLAWRGLDADIAAKERRGAGG